MTGTQNKYGSMYFMFLGAVLMIGLAYRFWDLSYYSLAGDGLFNAYVASLPTITDSVSWVMYGDSQPPGYVLFLKAVLTLIGDSDTALRLSSALAGVLSVYWTFRLGQLLFSTTAGLMAAVLLAGSYNAVLLSQSTMVYALFGCLALIHLEIYLRLFGNIGALDSDTQKKLSDRRPSESLPIEFIRINGFTISWRPAVAVNMQSLTLFWVTATILLYLHTMAMALLSVECMVMVILGWKRPRSELLAILQQAFLVPTLLFLVWQILGMPYQVYRIMAVAATSTADNSLDIWQTWRYLFGPDMVRSQTVIAGICLTTVVAAVLFWKKKESDARRTLLLLLVLSLLVVVVYSLALLVFPSIHSPRVLMFLVPIVYLVAVYGVSYLVASLPSAASVFVLLVFLASTLDLQVDKNRKGYLFARDKQEVRQAVELIASDASFMKGPRRLYSSHEVVEFYINRYKIRDSNRHITNSWEDGAFYKLDRRIDNKIFYYIELLDPADKNQGSPLLRKMFDQYTTVCISNLKQVKVVKFVAQAPTASGISAVGSCPMSAASVLADTQND